MPDSKRKSLLVPHDNLLVLDTTNGTALVQFTNLWVQGVAYRWRFRDKISGAVSAGSGDASEKYKTVFKLGSSRFLKDAGSQPYIKVGDHLWCLWSYSSVTSAWIYYHPERTDVGLLPTNDFQTLDLSEITSIGEESNKMPGHIP